MSCTQCHIYQLSLVGKLANAEDAARLVAVYHAYHGLCAAGEAPLARFRCLDCQEEGPPVLPHFQCALCGGSRVEAVGPTGRRAPERGADRTFAARLQGDVELDVLRETLRMNGLPAALRAPCWKLLLRYHAPDRVTREAEVALFRRKYEGKPVALVAHSFFPGTTTGGLATAGPTRR